MTAARDASVDGVLIEWGERLFYSSNRIVRTNTPRLRTVRERASAVRARIEAAVRRAPQVMVKVTGGGRGMRAIAAHFRYISKNGRLDIEDDQGTIERGREGLKEIEAQWRLGGSCIDNDGFRREAFNVMLSMPHGTDPLTVMRAAREFARIEFAEHRYVMVLHDHQANPHVHLSVKAASKQGQRLNPRKADLRRWRETFAERLREWGVDAEASRQATRGFSRHDESLWRVKARVEGRERKVPMGRILGKETADHPAIRDAWRHIESVLASSADALDRKLAREVGEFCRGGDRLRGRASRVQGLTPTERGAARPDLQMEPQAAVRTRIGPDIGR